MKNCRAMCKTAPLLMYAFSRKYARKSLLSMGGGKQRANYRRVYSKTRFRRCFSEDGLFSCPFANRHETV